MSAAVSGMRAGQPSTTQPIAGPWLSPKVVTRKRWPKVLNDMGFRPVAGVVARTLGGVKWEKPLFECWRTRWRPSKCSPRQRRSGSDLLLLADDDVGGVGMLHADDVVAGIDVMDLAGDPAREVGEEVDRGVANLLDGDAAPERRIVLVPLENVAEVADACRCERLDRPRGDGIDTDVLRAEISGEVAHRGFERGLGDAHHVVVRHPFLGAVIGEREQCAAPRHQLLGALSDGGERIAAD